MRRQYDLVILAVQRLGRDLGDGPDGARRGRRAPAPRPLVGARPAQPRPRRAARRLPRRRTAPGGAVGRQGHPRGARPRRPGRRCWPPARCRRRSPGSPPPCAMVLARVVTPCRRPTASVSWQTVVLVGALIPLSTAIQTSGAADQISSVLIDAVGDGQPVPAAGRDLPAHRRARPGREQHRDRAGRRRRSRSRRPQATGTRCKPVLMVVAIAGCAALLTPIATPGNMMIMTPGRLPVRRLLEARAAGHGLVVRGRARRRAPGVGPVTTRPAIASTDIDERGATW